MFAAEIIINGFLFCAFLLCAVIAYQLITNPHATSGLLSTYEGMGTDPERILLLFATVWGCAYMVVMSLETPATASAEFRTIAELPDWLVAIIGGGQLSYLTGKGIRSKFNAH